MGASMLYSCTRGTTYRVSFFFKTGATAPELAVQMAPLVPKLPIELLAT